MANGDVWLLHCDLSDTVAYSVSSVDKMQGSKENDTLSEQIEFLGYVKGNIVGIRYYSGLVSNKEMVALCREPQNPYDCNAVRVNNIRGEQVGHIKREMARALAQVVDKGLATLEGLVPTGSKNIYSIPVDISFWGDESRKDEVAQTMKKYGYTVMQNVNTSENSNNTDGSKRYRAAGRKATQISSDQMRSELDGLFEKLKEVDQSAEEAGCDAIKSVLYPHQKRALAWMRKREGGLELPPFWEKLDPKAKTAMKAKGQTVYFNTITNFSTTNEPNRVRGGILADDMGLGKTLITIALIFGNSWNGQPLHTKLSDEKSNELKKRSVLEIKEESEIIDLTQDEDTLDIKCDIEEVSVVEEVNNAQIEDVTPTQQRRSRRVRKRPVVYAEEADCQDSIQEEQKSAEKRKRKRVKKEIKEHEEDTEYIPQDFPHLSKKIELDQRVFSSKIEESYMPKFTKAERNPCQPGCTLIICPLSLMENWQICCGATRV